VIIVAYAIPGFLFAILLLVLFAGGSDFQIFPLRGLTSDNFEELSADRQDRRLLLAHHAAGAGLDDLGLRDADAADQEQLPRRDQEAIRDDRQGQGPDGAPVLYGHVFRNAMLIVIAGFPAVFIGVFFGGSLIIETIFSLDGLGRLGFEAAVSRDYPVIFGTLFVFGLIGLLVNIMSDLMYVWIDPRIDFETRET
jgi:microcin C transport system permease protein